ncbi:hypothetical protein LX36DRAFT_61930 [Colletotrichum falcatum]|nr:hypothetical protein LX36DRAFT_61930 [Colletotrichum falcatum]
MDTCPSKPGWSFISSVLDAFPTSKYLARVTTARIPIRSLHLADPDCDSPVYPIFCFVHPSPPGPGVPVSFHSSTLVCVPSQILSLSIPVQSSFLLQPLVSSFASPFAVILSSFSSSSSSTTTTTTTTTATATTTRLPLLAISPAIPFWVRFPRQTIGTISYALGRQCWISTLLLARSSHGYELAPGLLNVLSDTIGEF